jgi:hypothetical protein
VTKAAALIFSLCALGAMNSHALAASNCNAQVRQQWNASSKHKFTLEAISNGPDCNRAVVLLVARDAKGEVQWTLIRRASYVAMFSPEATKNGKDMPGALKRWLATGSQSNLKTMDKLPDWKKGADGPAENPPAEFPFTVSDELDRDTYLAWRKAKLPLLCFVQGMESELCITSTDQGLVTEVGIQSFPGMTRSHGFCISGNRLCKTFNMPILPCASMLPPCRLAKCHPHQSRRNQSSSPRG